MKEGIHLPKESCALDQINQEFKEHAWKNNL